MRETTKNHPIIDNRTQLSTKRTGVNLGSTPKLLWLIVLFACAASLFHTAKGQSSPAKPGALQDADLQRLQQLKIAGFKKDTFKIQNYGGAADGLTLNTTAIQKAIDKCHNQGGGVVNISAGIWLTGPLVLKSDVNLHIDRGAILQFTGDFNAYPLIETNYEGLEAVRCQAPISAKDQHHLAITGSGIIDGSGDSWRMVKKSKLTESQWKTLVATGGVLNDSKETWYPTEGSLKGSKMEHPGVLSTGKSLADYKAIKDYLRPNLLSLTSCKEILLEGVTFQNSPAWCLHPLQCENMIIRSIYAKNPWYGQNGDGLDLESCKQVLIENSSFDVGDDGICMKSGRDEEGRKRDIPTQSVLIQFSTVYHAHGGFVIGSEMSGGVKNVFVRHCNFIGTDIGLRFKTTRGRGGIVENIYINDINMRDIAGDAISFDMYYEAKDPVALNGEQRADPKVELRPVTAGTPRFKNFFIENIFCHGAEHAVFFRGLPEMPIQNIFLQNLVMKTSKGMALTEADHIYMDNIKLQSGQTDPLVKLFNTRNLFLKNISTISDTTQPNNNSAQVPTMEIGGKGSNNIQLKQSSGNCQPLPEVRYVEGADKKALNMIK